LVEKYGNLTTKNEKSTKEVLKEIQHLMIANIQPNLELNNILKQLKQQYLLVLATNGSKNIQQKKIDKAGLAEIFTSKNIYISEAVGYSKPDMRYYNYMLKSSNKKPKQCMMIGDNFLNDIIGAKKCRIYTCWMKNGNHIADKNADIILNKIEDIHQWLKA
jgi:HAD superfamily hydrolase (TIGR01549 family)